MNIFFGLNKNKDLQFIKSNEIISFLLKNNCDVYVEEKYLSNLKNTHCFVENTKIDFAIILGGDGTILSYAHYHFKNNFPFFGINLGRVGCLTEATLDNYQEKIMAIINKNFIIEERNTITCQLIRANNIISEHVAFNEVSLQRGKLIKMLLINMYVNNKNKTSFYADGVIIATSTGSSAYNMSSGGPLLLPTAKNYVITPICPQVRTLTSLVVNDTDSISIDIKEVNERQSYKENHPIINIDGFYSLELEKDDVIKLFKTDKTLKLIKVNQEASLFEATFKVAMSNQNL